MRLAVVGGGRAGMARVRAIESLDGAELACLVRREPEPGAATLDDVLADPSVDALVVCTPNVLHAATVRAGLEASKHVLVEYPLAPGPRIALELFALARQRERVLHVEHIELLSPSQRALRAAAAGLGRPTGGHVSFTGRLEGWVGDAALAGSTALRAVARLHRLVDLFGEAEVRSAALRRGTGGSYRLDASLGFVAGGEVALIEERDADLRRATTWQVTCERGELTTPEAGPPGELFREDTGVFLKRVREGEAGYLSDERVVHVLSLVEAIERAARS